MCTTDALGSFFPGGADWRTIRPLRIFALNVELTAT
jgi:hypothetical protein